MKKSLTGALLLVLATFYSCQKNETATNINVKEPSITKKTDSYYSTTLNPSATDPNVYTGSYQGVSFTVSGLGYDDVAYPNNVDGVPAIGNLLPVDPQNSVTQSYIKDGSSYAVIAEHVASMSLLAGLNIDIDDFHSAFTTWVNNGAPVGQAPLFTDYIKPTYSTSGGNTIATISCKLIRRVLGNQTYYAIADPDYPQPSPVSNSTPTTSQPCSLTLNGVTYDFYLPNGTSGNVNCNLYDAYTSAGYIADAKNWQVIGTFSNYSAKSLTVTLNINIYETGINNTITYSGPGVVGIQ